MSKTIFDRISASLRKHAMKDDHDRPYAEKGNYIFLVYDPFKNITTHYTSATMNGNFATLVEALIRQQYESADRNTDYETFLKETLEDIWKLQKDKTGNDNQPMLPGMEEAEETENDEDETLDFMLFMDPTGRRKGAIRIMNTLIRNGITSKKIFAEHDPLDFIKFRWIGIISMPYILERHAEARKMIGLAPIPEPNINAIAEKAKEKNKEAQIERRKRWNDLQEQMKQFAATENSYRICK